MNFRLNAWAVSLALVVGGVPALRAMAVTVTGTPPDHYLPVNATSIQQFISSHPDLSPDDVTQFSAEVVHNDRVGSDVPTASAINPLSPAPAVYGRASTANSLTVSRSSNSPCPKGYNNDLYDPQTGQYTCDQEVESDLTNPNDPNDHYYLDTALVVDSSGNGVVHHDPIDGSISSYGVYTMRLLDLAPGHVTYVGQYEAYFFATPQDENTFVTAACAGTRVIYETPPGTVAQGGYPYQVNVADPVPNGSTDVTDPANLSPLPTGASNLCPAPSPSNN